MTRRNTCPSGRLDRGAPLVLEQGESVLLEGRGAYKWNRRGGWKPVNLLLTRRRLACLQAGRIALELDRWRIASVRPETPTTGLALRSVLAVSFSQDGSHTERPRTSTFWLSTDQNHLWERELRGQAARAIDRALFERLVRMLGPDASRILQYVEEKTHARIDELADLIGAPTHMDVLLAIRGTINRVARQVIGCPILVFERSREDPWTGEKVLYSWWLSGRLREEPAEPPVDLFDEDGHFLVLIGTSGVDESDISIEIEDDILIICADGMRICRKEVLLPGPGDVNRIESTHRNGILILKIAKKVEAEGPGSVI